MTPPRVATLTAAIAAAQLLIELTPLARDAWTNRLTLVVLVLCAVGTVYLATRPRWTASDAVLGLLCSIALFGALGAALLFVLLEGPGAGGYSSDWIGCALAACGGAFAGVLLTPWMLPLVLIGTVGRSHPDHEAPVRALLLSGGWLLVLPAFYLAFDRSAFPAAVVPGGLLVAVAGWWTARRARFVRRVRADLEPGFAIVESEVGVVESGLLPYRPLRGPCIVDTLVGLRPGSSGAYRDAGSTIPLCLVQRQPGAASARTQ